MKNLKKTDFRKLVEKAANGDKDCLDRILTMCGARLENYLMRITLDRNLAADLKQETLVRIMQNIRALKNPDRFWCWAFQIAGNLARRHLKKKHRRNTVNFSDADETIVENALLDQQLDAENKMMLSEKIEVLKNAMTRLADTPQAVVTMRCIEHKSYAQISGSLGCSKAAAKTMFSRARKQLRTCCMATEACSKDEPDPAIRAAG